MSALPSATRPNFTAEPSVFVTASGRPSMKASVLASPCERLTAAIQGSPRVGQRAGADRLGSADASCRRTVRRSAPRPTMPAPEQPERGRADDAEQRHAFGHQREVDGEFVAAGDELLGAVERIDQEEAAAKWRRGQLDALFRQRRHVAAQAAPGLRR